ncbi:MAG: HdaA/DnaA family protein [Alphaproteobacteria bacterium]
MQQTTRPTPEQIPLAFPVRVAQGREDFMVGTSNEAAVGWIDRWPDWSAPSFILSGPAASGKSHLAAVWQARTGATAIPTETLTTQSAEEIAAQGETLLLDGIDPWIGTREAEETLFHLYNIFKEEQRTMLLTMRSAPSHLDFTIPDLASRLRAAPHAVIMSPCETLLQNVIVKMFADRQINIGADVLKYILPRMERSFTAAKDIVTAADALALSQKRPVTVPLIRDVLINL